MQIRAETIPFSSVVGGGVVLMDESGRVIGQLGLMSFSGSQHLNDPITPETAATYKTEYVAMCDRIAAAINAGQAERQVRHYKNPDVSYDVVAEKALFQVSTSNVCGAENCRTIDDGEEVTVYRNPDGMHFVRFPDEMAAPRFEEI